MKLQTFKNKLQTLQAAQSQKNSKQNNWGSGRGGRPWRRLKAK
ncbi:TPA: HNH endonuclease, partial [Acinetobacter baumannii]